MPKRLFDLTIDEVSLVDEPANQYAKVVLFKREQGPALEAAAATIATADPQSFAELLAIEEGEELVRELGNTLFRHINLLQHSLAAILESDAADKPGLIRESLDQFGEAIDADLPTPEDLAKALQDCAAGTAKGLRLPSAAEIDAADPLAALSQEIAAAAGQLMAKGPGRFSRSAAIGAILAANLDARAQLEALQNEAMARTSRSEKKEISMFKMNDVVAATTGAQVNVAKARDALDDDFDEVVRKAQREGESFAAAYARVLDSDTGRDFYEKRFAFRAKAAVISKIAEEALRFGRFAPNLAGIQKGGDNRQALEKAFDEFVAANRRDNETHEAAYVRLLETKQGLLFYGKRLAIA